MPALVNEVRVKTPNAALRNFAHLFGKLVFVRHSPGKYANHLPRVASQLSRLEYPEQGQVWCQWCTHTASVLTPAPPALTGLNAAEATMTINLRDAYNDINQLFMS
jgi:hypothetical protein